MSAAQDVAEQPPVHLGRTAPPREPMPGRRDNGCRETPMGWPMDGTNSWHAVAIEALGGAGVAGSISCLPVGDYSCGKRLDRCTTVQCRTMVYSMAVGKPMHRPRERKGCICRCCSFRKAATPADEREISKLPKDLAGNLERLTKMEEMREASRGIANQGRSNRSN